MFNLIATIISIAFVSGIWYYISNKNKKLKEKEREVIKNEAKLEKLDTEILASKTKLEAYYEKYQKLKAKFNNGSGSDGTDIK